MSSPLCKRVHRRLAPRVPLVTPPLNSGVAWLCCRMRRQKAYCLDPAMVRAPCLIYGHLWEILHWIVPAGKATLMVPVRSRWWSLVVPMEAAIPACKSFCSDSLDDQTELLDEGSGVMRECRHNIISFSIGQKKWLSLVQKQV
jgi:hypothetical protein